MIHELPLGSTPLHGAYSRDLPPVLTAAPGDSVRLTVPSSRWRLGPAEEVERPDPERDTGHALAGPVEVRGARAGQVLAVRIDEVTPWGWGDAPAADRRRRGARLGRGRPCGPGRR
ncbi:MAG: acetamidase/formamidase family protein [Gaiella sp.]|nr:acetamidase/formamidase family protein [Gaiella sp.]